MMDFSYKYFIHKFYLFYLVNSNGTNKSNKRRFTTASVGSYSHVQREKGVIPLSIFTTMYAKVYMNGWYPGGMTLIKITKS